MNNLTQAARDVLSERQHQTEQEGWTPERDDRHIIGEVVMSFYRETPIKATRKTHDCSWCPEPIDMGQPAAYRAYVIDGSFQADHMHPECLDAMHRSLKVFPDDTFDPNSQKRGVSYDEYGDPFIAGEALEGGK
ncbi:MAG: hypothetical protein H6Q00_1393 [Holophagaceae bacterium]|nr:hypothetical protein [Holophagaceae bacterium]